jgi:hypothetical protein
MCCRHAAGAPVPGESRATFADRSQGLTRLRLLGISLWTLALSATGSPANPLNPDLSVIGDMRLVSSDADDRTELVFEELELGIVGPLNPYARAEAYLAIHGTEGIEVEEARLHLDRYLPLGLGLTAGQYLLGVGKLNPLHPHAYPFVDRPLMHESFFGPDGARDMGVRLDWFVPVEGITLRAAVDAVRGDVFLGGHHHEDDDHARRGELPDDELEEEPEIGVLGRLELFAEPSDDVAVSLGGSILRGEYDPHDGAVVTFAGPDLKLAWDLGPRRSLVVNAEALFGRVEGTDEQEEADPFGWFASADLRLSSRWSVGGFAESTTERMDDDHATNRFGGFAGLALMEESTVFRLLVRSTDPEEGDAVFDVAIQALFGLGPHQPHRY